MILERRRDPDTVDGKRESILNGIPLNPQTSVNAEVRAVARAVASVSLADRNVAPMTPSTTTEPKDPSNREAFVKEPSPKEPSHKEPILKPLPIKFMDEKLKFYQESIIPHLQSQSDFLVVGSLGRECVGKSFLLNALLPENAQPFPTRSFFASHCTSGFELNVTYDRYLLIDSQVRFCPPRQPGFLNLLCSPSKACL